MLQGFAESLQQECSKPIVLATTGGGGGGGEGKDSAKPVV